MTPEIPPRASSSDSDSGIRTQPPESLQTATPGSPLNSELRPSYGPSTDGELPTQVPDGSRDASGSLITRIDSAGESVAVSLNASSPATSRTSSLRFRMLKAHAEGGLGRVSLARDAELKRDVAVKEIKERFADLAESRARFVFEAEVTGQLEHPGIVPIYALGTHADGRPFYAMRFISGNSLEAAIEQLHSITDPTQFERKLRDLLVKLVQVSNTIEYAHHRGFIHRDLKPANIMLGDYGETLVVDWGLAKQYRSRDTYEPAGDIATPSLSEELDKHESAATRHGAVVGTPQYMPPEQTVGDSSQMTPSCDVYSLGATLYHLLTGKAPFTDRQQQSVREVLARVRQGKLRRPRELNPRVPKSLDAITMAAMSVAPEQRYSSARAFATDIENWLADDRVSVMPETITQRAGRWLRKHRSLASAMGGALVIIATVASIAFVITNRALTRTELLLACAKLEQQFDRLTGDEERRIVGFSGPVSELPVTSAQAQQLTGLIREIESLRERTQRSQVDQERRDRLLQVWASSLEQITRRPMNVETGRLLVAEIQRLAQEYAWSNDQAKLTFERLEQLAERRIRDWFDLPVPAFPASAFETLAMPDQPASAWQRKPCEFSEWPIALADCPVGNLDLTVKFSGNVLQTSMIGLLLNDVDGVGYRCVIADEAFHPLYLKADLPSIEESSKLNRLWFFLVRGDTILRKMPAELRSGSEIRLRREQGTLLTAVFNGQQMTFQDLYPLSPRVPGRWGVICPAGIVLDHVRIQNQQPSKAEALDDFMLAIEKGDLAFAEGDFPAARVEYQKVPDDVEALFKLALTYEGEDPNRYLELLRAISVNKIQDGADDPRERKWYLYASIRLLASGFGASDWKMRAAETLDRLRSNYSMLEIQELIPESEKQRFSDVLLKSGQRFSLAFLNAGDTDDLRATLDLFSHDAQTHRFARWRLADAIRFDRKLSESEACEQAKEILLTLIEEVEGEKGDALAIERGALISDFVWVVINQGRGTEGLELVNRLLEQEASQIPVQYLPLYIDRARLYYALDRKEEAKRDLETYLDRVDPNTPPLGNFHAHYGSACAILGLLLEEAGKDDEAQAVWLKGRRRNWGPGWPKPKEVAMARGIKLIFEADNPEGQLTAWSDGYRDNEYMNVIECMFAGSGVDDVAVRRLIFNTDRIPREWMKLVAERTCAGPRGKEVGKSILLRTISLRELPYQVLTLVLYRGVMDIAYDGEQTLRDHPAVDQVVYDQCRSIIENFQAQKLQQKDLAFILGGFTGSWNERTFQNIEKRVEDRGVTSGVALILGTMMIKHKQLYEEGEDVLQRYVIDRQADLPYVYFEMAQEALRKIPGKKPSS